MRAIPGDAVVPPFYIAIPARCASSRLPDKPLLEIAGKSLLERVYENVCAAGAREVIVAAGDDRVLHHARSLGATAYATDPGHPNGTQRIAEAVEHAGWEEDSIVVDVQGDEPFLPVDLPGAVAADLAAHPAAFAATISVPLAEDEWENPHSVKVWTDAEGYAQGFARTPGEEVARAQCRRHVGLYAYRVRSLRLYARLSRTLQEMQDSLEQWRILEHDLRLHVLEIPEAPPGGVDTADDLVRVRRMLEEGT